MPQPLHTMPVDSSTPTRPVLSLRQATNGGPSATVLLVEDAEDDIEFIKMAFDRAKVKYPLKVVRSVDEALGYLKGEGIYSDRVKYPFPALVLLDLKFPGRSGFELLEWLKLQATFQRLVVVVLTGSHDPADQTRAYQLGANAFVVKSVGYGDLINLLQSFQLRG